MDGCPFPPGILLSRSSGMQSVLKSINFYKDHSRWTLQYPSSATVYSSYYPQVTGALAHWSMHMVVCIAGSYYPRELRGYNNLGMLFPLRSWNHFLNWLMFEEGPSVLSKLMVTTAFDVSVSTSKEKSLFCFPDSKTSNFVSVEGKMRSDRLICRKRVWVKYYKKRTALLNKKKLWKAGRGCLGRWWDLGK